MKNYSIFGLKPAVEFYLRMLLTYTKFHSYPHDVCCSATKRFLRHFLPPTTAMEPTVFRAISEALRKLKKTFFNGWQCIRGATGFVVVRGRRLKEPPLRLSLVLYKKMQFT